MNIEILKRLIYANYLNVNEANWLSRTFENQFESFNSELTIQQIGEELLNLLKSKITEIENKSIEDNLYIYSTIRHIEFSIKSKFNDLSNEIEEVDEEDTFSLYTKEELAKLQKTEDHLFQIGHEPLLKNLLNLIETKYAMVYNGFNKLEYQRAKSQFWKNIGLEGFGYRALSTKGKKFLDDIYNSSEPIIKQRITKKEKEILPDLTNNFIIWVKTNNHKLNKTNLKQYLKENDIKLSNPNIDKILFNLK